MADQLLSDTYRKKDFGNDCLLQEQLAIKSNKFERVPSVIHVCNLTVYQLNKIHRYALRSFDNERKLIPRLKTELERLENSLQPSQTIVERKVTIDKIKSLDQEIKGLERNEREKTYLAEVKPLMTKFCQCAQKTTKIKFGDENYCQSEQLTQLMLKIIDCLRKRTQLTFNVELKVQSTCEACQYNLSETIPNIDGVIICPNCQTENDIARCPNRQYATEQLLHIPDGSYGEKGEINNFEKFLEGFEGKRKLDVTKIKTKLDHYFRKNRILIGSEFKEKYPLDRKNFRSGTSFNMMLKALVACSLNEHYKNIYIVCREYWGWVLPNLQRHRDRIMHIYTITRMAYHQIKQRDRTSMISIPFHSFKIFELIGLPYESCDFKIPEDEKSWVEREQLWKTMCQQCGDDTVYYIPTK